MGFWSAFLSRLPVVGVKITVFAIVGHPRNLVRKFFNFEKYQMANGRRRLGKKSFEDVLFFVIKREIQSKRLLLRYFFWTYLKPILQKERNTNWRRSHSNYMWHWRRGGRGKEVSQTLFLSDFNYLGSTVKR